MRKGQPRSDSEKCSEWQASPRGRPFCCICPKAQPGPPRACHISQTWGPDPETSTTKEHRRGPTSSVISTSGGQREVEHGDVQPHDIQKQSLKVWHATPKTAATKTGVHHFSWARAEEPVTVSKQQKTVLKSDTSAAPSSAPPTVVNPESLSIYKSCGASRRPTPEEAGELKIW